MVNKTSLCLCSAYGAIKMNYNYMDGVKIKDNV